MRISQVNNYQTHNQKPQAFEAFRVIGNDAEEGGKVLKLITDTVFAQPVDVMQGHFYSSSSEHSYLMGCLTEDERAAFIKFLDENAITIGLGDVIGMSKKALEQLITIPPWKMPEFRYRYQRTLN